MKKFFMLILLACVALDLFGWGRLGHDAIAYIAECNLTPKAKKIISEYLDGKSIVYYSSWMDDVRRTPEYKFSTSWHVAYVDGQGEPCLGKNFPEGKYKGDALLEILRLTDKLGNYRELSDSTVAVGIKMLVHLVGDMHCPGHVYYPGQCNSFKVRFGGREVSYHSVWDDGFIGSIHKWSYMEYNHQLGNLDRKEAAAIVAGTPVDWERENARNCKVIYDWAAPGAVLGDDFKLAAWSLADSQIQKAGYRLASVLNAIFK